MDSWCVKREFESLNFRIPDSRRLSSKYTNTFVAVQKKYVKTKCCWTTKTIMHNGGEGFKYGVRMIFHMGGKSTSSTKN
jgi:hypothetical protein